ncbi:MAG TPA: tRNA lysidine(34) synthetase TilS [Pyrinomonadaceae bacterium]|nr:tRNA lysidine(34) synthetase TilS [Pyrinomonadaceae bacterium]
MIERTTKLRNQRRGRRKPLTRFAQQLNAEWKRLGLLRQADTLVVAVSGGADSTALLLALHELITAKKFSVRLVVAHLDHGLRPMGKKDAEWVSKFAAKLGHVFVTHRAAIRQTKHLRKDNLEQAARRKRYEFLQQTASEQNSYIVLTAHTLDDNAETILMRLLRGSAAEGLSGMEAVRPLGGDSQTLLVRPLLSWAKRSDTQAYCRLRRIEPRIDEMNEDERFTRVRIRKQLLPLMASFNNRIVETLSRTATLLREDAAVLAAEANQLLLRAMIDPPAGEKIAALDVKTLVQAPAAIRRRALRRWIALGCGDLRRLEMVHILGVERLLDGPVGGRVAELPNRALIKRKRGWLQLHVKNG